jgi:hypothetical protein
MTVLAVDTQPSVWAAAPGTDEGALLGRNSTSKIGFFGTTPVVRGAVFDLSSGTVAELAAILAAYGLITTQA